MKITATLLSLAVAALFSVAATAAPPPTAEKLPVEVAYVQTTDIAAPMATTTGFVKADLHKADLHKADLHKADLHKADLSKLRAMDLALYRTRTPEMQGDRLGQWFQATGNVLAAIEARERGVARTRLWRT